MNRKKQLFSQMILEWYDRHGRKHLPWQHPHSAYRVWLSEMMLQQTQVKTVIPYFNRFIERFPSVEFLANATEDEVMALWAGLGYYSRARNLHKTAQLIHQEFNNVFPTALDVLKKLPGIGPSTAAAIASLAFDQPTAILDGNVKRVLCRYFGISGVPDEPQTKKKLWQLADDCMPKERCREYTQAIMDMGALCCTLKNPACHACPLQENCVAHLARKVDAFPEKKLKKKIPNKSLQVILMHTASNMIYLEKRPSPGIWGGLWSLPCVEKEIPLEHYLQTHYSVSTTNFHPFMELQHTLTHMKLSLQVITCEIKNTGDAKINDISRWFEHERAQHLGMPKPMQVIVKAFCKKHLELIDEFPAALAGMTN